MDASGHPRFISRDYARRIADTGGVVGGWIAVLWDDPWNSFIDHILRLVDAIGVAHVGIGTDMPVGVAETAMPDFTTHARIPEALAARGLAPEEVAAICGGNWLRVFRATRAT
jgi:membrane dipeptidase